MLEVKRCSRCCETKSITLFHKNKSMKDGISNWCKTCRHTAYKGRVNTPEVIHRSHLKKYYDITLEDYEDMLEIQDDRCAICYRTVEETNDKQRKNLCVDHNNETGQIRGLLCHNCNTGLGHFKEDIERMKNAILYLEWHLERNGIRYPQQAAAGNDNRR